MIVNNLENKFTRNWLCIKLIIEVDAVFVVFSIVLLFFKQNVRGGLASTIQTSDDIRICLAHPDTHNTLQHSHYQRIRKFIVFLAWRYYRFEYGCDRSEHIFAYLIASIIVRLCWFKTRLFSRRTSGVTSLAVEFSLQLFSRLGMFLFRNNYGIGLAFVVTHVPVCLKEFSQTFFLCECCN